MPLVEIVVPEPTDAPAQPARLAPRSSAAGRERLVLVDNGKPRARALLTLIAQVLTEQLRISDVVLHSKSSAAKPLTDDECHPLAAGAGLMIAALGDCGACSACSVNDAIQFERLGVPAVAVITEPFQSLVARFAVRLGLPEVSTTVLPHPVASRSDAELAGYATRVARAVAAQFSVAGAEPSGPGAPDAPGR